MPSLSNVARISGSTSSRLLGCGSLGLGGCPVVHVLVVDRRVLDLGPVRFDHGDEVPVGGQAPLEEPLGLVLLGRDQSDDVLVEALGGALGLDVALEAERIFTFDQTVDHVGHVASSFVGDNISSLG